MDAPVHRYRQAPDLAALPLDRLADLDTVVVDARQPDRAVGPELFSAIDVSDRAVLIRTDFSRHWATDEYFSDSPFLTAEASDLWVARGARFVGIDSLNIDSTADPSRPAHTKLLAAGIPICEHMTNLAAVPVSGGRLHAVPIAWVGGAGFPVRGYVLV
jgi:arylformamidase